MTAFTKQEQRFLLFLVITFFLGLSVKLVRHNLQSAPDEEWNEERERVLNEFQQKAQVLVREDSTLVENTVKRSVTKKSLTTKININTASGEELQLLPRVGPVLAESIILYREDKGPFKRIEEIQNVKRIGPKTFEEIKLYITVE